MEIFYEVLEESIHDSVKLIPFLFIAYLLIEYIEHKHSEKMTRILSGGGKFGPISGAALGLIPQCGFSVMAADLYASNVVTIGTLISVFIATSDEAIPILSANPDVRSIIVPLLGFKFVLAFVLGFFVDRILVNILPTISRGYTGHDTHIDCHDHNEKSNILKATLAHTIKVFLFILVINIIFASIIEYLGHDILGFLSSLPEFPKVLVTSLFGLIPNCAASVILTEMYVANTIGFPSLLSGLCVGAGLGPMILLRNMPKKKEAIKIIVLLYVLGIICGGTAMICGM